MKKLVFFSSVFGLGLLVVFVFQGQELSSSLVAHDDSAKHIDGLQESSLPRDVTNNNSNMVPHKASVAMKKPNKPAEARITLEALSEDAIDILGDDLFQRLTLGDYDSVSHTELSSIGRALKEQEDFLKRSRSASSADQRRLNYKSYYQLQNAFFASYNRIAPVPENPDSVARVGEFIELTHSEQLTDESLRDVKREIMMPEVSGAHLEDSKLNP